MSASILKVDKVFIKYEVPLSARDLIEEICSDLESLESLMFMLGEHDSYRKNSGLFAVSDHVRTIQAKASIARDLLFDHTEGFKCALVKE